VENFATFLNSALLILYLEIYKHNFSSVYSVGEQEEIFSYLDTYKQS